MPPTNLQATEDVKGLRNSTEFRYQTEPFFVAEVATLPTHQHDSDVVKSRRNSTEFRYQISELDVTIPRSRHPP
ncbi:hypothetical protein BH10PLA2_BH10PLA2_30450 [soil metagenome]